MSESTKVPTVQLLGHKEHNIAPPVAVAEDPGLKAEGDGAGTKPNSDVVKCEDGTLENTPNGNAADGPPAEGEHPATDESAVSEPTRDDATEKAPVDTTISPTEEELVDAEEGAVGLDELIPTETYEASKTESTKEPVAEPTSNEVELQTPKKAEPEPTKEVGLKTIKSVEEPQNEKPEEPEKEKPKEPETEKPKEPEKEKPKEPETEKPKEPETEKHKEPGNEKSKEPEKEKPKEPEKEKSNESEKEKPKEPEKEKPKEPVIEKPKEAEKEPETTNESDMELTQGVETANEADVAKSCEEGLLPTIEEQEAATPTNKSRGDTQTTKKETTPTRKRATPTKAEVTLAKKRATPTKTEATPSEGSEDEPMDTDEPQLGLLERPVEIQTGKRSRRQVERFTELAESPVVSEKKVSVPEGRGCQLADCPLIADYINKTKVDSLKNIHRILFNVAGKSAEIRKNIRKFSGFPFETESSEYNRKLTALTKFSVVIVRSFCDMLSLEKSGAKDALVERVMSYLMCPTAEGKQAKEKQPKTLATGSKRKRPEAKPKPDKVDEEEDDVEEGEHQEEQPAAKRRRNISPTKPSPRETLSRGRSKDAPRMSTGGRATRATSVKKPDKSPARGKGNSTPSKSPRRGKSKKEESEEEEMSGPPSNARLKREIQKILKAADLEEVTMKTVRRQVLDMFPEHDLLDKTAFIKSTVKEILGA